MNISVRDYLKQYPDFGLDLLTPAGLVKIPPRLGQELLAPSGGRMTFYICGSKDKVFASALLEQYICKIIRYRNDPWRVFILVNPPGEMSCKKTSSDALYEQASFLKD